MKGEFTLITNCRSAILRFVFRAATVMLTATASAAWAQVDVPLVQGWNLIGNAYYASANVKSIAGDINKVVSVWTWDKANGRWGVYMPSDLSGSYATSKNYAVLSTINPGEGCWVNANVGFILQLHATTPSPIPTAAFQAGSLALSQGWNLIATGDNPTPREFANGIASAALSPGSVAANSLISLWAWNAAISNWLLYMPGKDNDGTLSSYVTSKGFLEFTGSAATIAQNVGFWVNKP